MCHRVLLNFVMHTIEYWNHFTLSGLHCQSQPPNISLQCWCNSFRHVSMTLYDAVLSCSVYHRATSRWTVSQYANAEATRSLDGFPHRGAVLCVNPCPRLVHGSSPCWHHCEGDVFIALKFSHLLHNFTISSSYLRSAGWGVWCTIAKFLSRCNYRLLRSSSRLTFLCDRIVPLFWNLFAMLLQRSTFALNDVTRWWNSCTPGVKEKKTGERSLRVSVSAKTVFVLTA